MNWKALLSRMKLEFIKETHYEFFVASGSYDYKVKRYSDSTANFLTRCIEDWFNHYPGGVAEASRINNTGTPRKMKDGRIRWANSNQRLGLSDVRGSFKGRSISVEVKVGRDRQSDAQKKEQERITRSGGVYMLVKSFPDFLEQWQAHGFPIPEYEPVNKNLKAL